MVMSSSKAAAIQQRSMKIAQELAAEGFDGWMTGIAILGWMLTAFPKPIADVLTEGLKDVLRQFPEYPTK